MPFWLCATVYDKLICERRRRNNLTDVAKYLDLDSLDDREKKKRDIISLSTLGLPYLNRGS